MLSEPSITSTNDVEWSEPVLRDFNYNGFWCYPKKRFLLAWLANITHFLKHLMAVWLTRRSHQLHERGIHRLISSDPKMFSFYAFSVIIKDSLKVVDWLWKDFKYFADLRAVKWETFGTWKCSTNTHYFIIYFYTLRLNTNSYFMHVSTDTQRVSI